MALTVNNNIAAMNAYRNLSVTDGQMAKSLEKLSSGFRINRATDDAAGLAISEGLRAQIGGLKVAVRNTQDGISVVQTAEGALSETHSILQRMRDLAVQGSSDGSLTASALGNIQSEVKQLKSELDRISSTTSFNGKKLLDGSYAGTFQVGANAGETISVNLATAMGSTGLGVAGVDVTGTGTFTPGAAGAGKASTVNATGAAAATLTFTEIVAGDDYLDATDAVAVASYQKLDGTINFGGKTFDLKSVNYTSATTGAQARALLNTAAKNALGLTVDPFGAGTATTLAFSVTEAVPNFTAAGGFALPTFSAATGATNALAAIDIAINTVSTNRAEMGAFQNRFEHTINNLNIAVENLSASESRIRDTDMAKEMTNFTRTQILTQAGTAMLAQANQAPQGILKLLQ